MNINNPKIKFFSANHCYNYLTIHSVLSIVLNTHFALVHPCSLQAWSLNIVFLIYTWRKRLEMAIVFLLSFPCPHQVPLFGGGGGLNEVEPHGGNLDTRELYPPQRVLVALVDSSLLSFCGSDVGIGSFWLLALLKYNVSHRTKATGPSDHALNPETVGPNKSFSLIVVIILPVLARDGKLTERSFIFLPSFLVLPWGLFSLPVSTPTNFWQPRVHCPLVAITMRTVSQIKPFLTRS